MRFEKITTRTALIIGLFLGYQALNTSANEVALAWDPPTNNIDGTALIDLTGYNLYCGTSSRSFSTVLNVGNINAYVVTNLLQGSTYFFAVTAVGSNNVESDYSTELVWSVPDTTPPTISAVAAVSLTADASGTLAVPDFVQNAVVTDNCSPQTSIVVTQVPAAGTLIGPGITSVLVTVTDQSGNSAQATVLVTVVGTPTVTLSSTATGAGYVAPATISLTASVVANGHSLTKVQFLSGTNLIGESGVPFTCAWNNVAVGTYALLARLVYDTGTVVSSPLTVVVSSVPAPWNTQDIGTGIVPGQATVSNGVYTVSGAGNISGSADKFRYVYQALSGDGEIKARVAALLNAETGAKAGVMIRESLTEGSRHSTLSLSSSGQFEFLRRTKTGGASSLTVSTGKVAPNNWVRLVRSGQKITAYKSADGTTWTGIGSQSVSMASTITIGIVTASGNTSTLSTATIANVTVVP